MCHIPTYVGVFFIGDFTNVISGLESILSPSQFHDFLYL